MFSSTLLQCFSQCTGELLKLEEDGYLIYVDRDRMEKDKLMPKTKCFSAIVKLDMRVLDSAFFSIAKDSECNAALYETNYNKEIDKTIKQVSTTYTSDIRLVNFSLPSQLSECKYESYVN